MSTTNVIAIGVLSGEVQTPVAELRDIVKRLEITPAIVINHVPHFSDTDASRIARHIRERRT